MNVIFTTSLERAKSILKEIEDSRPVIHHTAFSNVCKWTGLRNVWVMHVIPQDDVSKRLAEELKKVVNSYIEDDGVEYTVHHSKEMPKLKFSCSKPDDTIPTNLPTRKIYNHRRLEGNFNITPLPGVGNKHIFI